MSDMFDHNADAYNQFVVMEESDDFCQHRNVTNNKYVRRYHKKYFHAIKAETKHAYLIHFVCTDKAVWVPKVLCGCLDKTKKSIFVWKGTRGVISHQTISVIQSWKSNGRP